MSRSVQQETERDHRVKDMEQTISRIEKQIGFRKRKTLPIALIVGVMTPICVLAILYFAQPKFTTVEGDDKNGTRVRDNGKLVKFTVLITVVFYAATGALVYLHHKKSKKAA